MSSRARRPRRLGSAVPAAVMLLCALLVSWARPVRAQNGVVILWIPLVAEDAAIERQALENVIADVLAQAEDADHIVGVRGLTSTIADGFPLPDCLQGVTPCTSPVDAVLSTLGVTLVVTVTAHEDGRRLEVDVSDASMSHSSSFEVGDASLREAVFRLLSELTGATAVLRVSSEPAGARVLVDGEEIGPTPIETTLPIGLYQVSVLFDGYDSWFDDTELRAGEAISLHAQLQRRFAELTVRSGTSGAAVRIDGGDELFPVGEPIRLEPGIHEVVVEAPGYTPVSQEFDLQPGMDFESRVILVLSPEELRRRRRERLLAAPVLLEGSLTLGGHSASLEGAGLGEPAGEELRCPLSPGTDECADPLSIGTVGMQVDVRYTWWYIELGLLGAGIERLGVSPESPTLGVESGDLRLEGGDGRRATLRFLQPGARWLWRDILEPWVRTGPAWSWESFAVRPLDGAVGEETRARRSGLWWDVGIGVRVHFNPLVYASIGWRLGVDLAHDGTSPTSTVLGSVGVNLPDPIGLRGALDDLRRGGEAGEGESDGSGEPPPSPGTPDAPSEL